MREVTKLMIYKYNLLELGFDFMGYEFQKEKELTFHHLIVPKRLCKVQHVEEDGYIEQNGAILQKNAHSYLHITEQYDRDVFDFITCQMVDMNLKGHLDMDNLKRIDDVLCMFEREYSGARTKSGKPLIKEAYTRRIRR